MWEEVCRRYERREIGQYQLEEMKEVIWPTLNALAVVRRCVNDLEPSQHEIAMPKRKLA